MRHHEASFESNERLREWLERAKRYRFEDIDDLPVTKVSHEDPNYQYYKCRTNWWQGLLSLLKPIRHTDAIPNEEARGKINAFIAYAKTIDYSKFRTREEIDAANTILDVLIDQLEKK